MLNSCLIRLVRLGILISALAGPIPTARAQSEGEFCGPNNTCDEGFRCVRSEDFTIVETCGLFSFLFGCDEEKVFRLVCAAGEIPPSVPNEEPPPVPGSSEPNVGLEQKFWCIAYIDENGEKQSCDGWRALVTIATILFVVTFFVIIIVLG